MTELSLLAVQNIALLRELNRHVPHETARALAEAIERDESNLSKSLKALRAEGLVEDGALRLTPAGLDQVNAVGRAEHGRADMLPKGWAVLRHADIRPDPANPRTDLDEAEAQVGLDELAESIAQRGLLQNPLVSPEGVLRAGERRWRAIGRLIQRGDSRWPAERPILCQVREGEDATEALIDALVENVQRRDLNPMDYADGLRKLSDAGKSAAQIKALLGEEGPSKRNIQELVQFSRELSPEDREGYRTGKLTREKARERVGAKKAPPVLELSPLAAMALAEIALAARLHPAPAELFTEPGYTRLYVAPTGGPVDHLYQRKLIGLKLIGADAYAKVMAASTLAGAWLESIGFDADPQGVTQALREKALGALRASGLASWATPELRKPEPREAPAPGPTPAPDLASPSPAPAGDAGGGPPPEPPPAATSEGLAPAEEPAAMAPLKRLALVELAHKIRTEAVPTRGPLVGCHVGAYRDDRIARELLMSDSLIMLIPAKSGDQLVACLSPEGKAWFQGQGYPYAEGVFGITDGDLYDARAAASIDYAHGMRPGEYVTAWLDAAAAPADPLPQPEPAHAVREAPPPAPYASDFGRAVLQAQSETAALRRLDAALAEAVKLIAKGKTKRLDEREADQVLALIDAARGSAAPHLAEAA